MRASGFLLQSTVIKQNMEYMYSGNNLFIKFNFKPDYVGKYRFNPMPNIKRAVFLDSELDLYVTTARQTYEEFGLELEIYNPEQNKCVMRITKEDGEFEDFLIMEKITKISSFGDKGDFLLVPKGSNAASSVDLFYHHCKLKLTTWMLRPEKNEHGTYLNGVPDGYLPCERRTETDGGVSALHFAVAGTSSQHFTRVGHAKRIPETEYKKEIKFHLDY